MGRTTRLRGNSPLFAARMGWDNLASVNVCSLADAVRRMVPRAFVFPVPAALNDESAAALPNPGMSAWLSLTYRAKLMSGESVLILGATGVTGRLAVRLAKLLGAGRVVGAGRNPEGLRSLLQLGADATIRLDTPDNELRESFLREAGASVFQVVIDYLWGHPTEVFLSAITSKTFAAIGTETRLVQVGETAGPNIAFPAVVLRSTALTVLGTAGIPSLDILNAAFRKVMNYAAAADLSGGNH